MLLQSFSEGSQVSRLTVSRLWESSWADDAAVWDNENGVAFDASKIKKIEHQGRFSSSTIEIDTHSI